MTRAGRGKRSMTTRSIGGDRNAIRAEQMRALGRSDRAIARELGADTRAVARWFGLRDRAWRREQRIVNHRSAAGSCTTAGRSTDSAALTHVPCVLYQNAQP
jgi:hypothetical protein